MQAERQLELISSCQSGSWTPAARQYSQAEQLLTSFCGCDTHIVLDMLAAENHLVVIHQPDILVDHIIKGVLAEPGFIDEESSGLQKPPQK